jgi:hypothetical protein
LLSLILFCDNKIVQLFYNTKNKLFKLTNTIIAPTPFTINKIYCRCATKTMIIDDNYNVNLTTDNVVIAPLHFDCRVTDIIYGNIYNYMYLFTKRLLYDNKGKLLSTEMFTQKISRDSNTKSANFICNAYFNII